MQHNGECVLQSAVAECYTCDMSYDLNLHFDPAVDRKAFVAYFAHRKHYVSNGTTLMYQNADTGVNFVIRYRTTRAIFTTKKVADAHIEVNYFRPSCFGVEAEREVSALVAEFAPKIDDPQIKGMGQGPYSPQGFLSGWNYGNAFAVRSISANNPNYKVPVMAAEKLRAAWRWNYNRPELTAKANDQQFVPGVFFVKVRDVPSLATVWALGMPILLPTVDYVLVARDEAGVKVSGLSPWSEVVDVVRGAGIEVGGDPLDIKYATTPGSIAKWIAEIPTCDLSTLPRLNFHEVIDAELVPA